MESLPSVRETVYSLKLMGSNLAGKKKKSTPKQQTPQQTTAKVVY